MPFTEAVANFPASAMNKNIPNGTYTPWQLLEHLRITQWDILDFIINKNYKELEWPKDYWPEKFAKATQKDWDYTIETFEKDVKALQNIVKNPKTDLFAKIPWGSGQNILREVLLVADHNAYHIGEFTSLRQVMGTWDKSHK